MKVRGVTPEDFEAVAALLNPVIRDTAIHFGTVPVTAVELREEWQASAARYPYLVAEIDGVFAGFAKASAWRTRAAYAWTAETGIYVDPAFHRRGIGRILYRALFDACRERGLAMLVAGIALPNDASVALHEAVGFRPVGVFHRCGLKFGRYHDVGFWELALDGEPG